MSKLEPVDFSIRILQITSIIFAISMIGIFAYGAYAINVMIQNNNKSTDAIIREYRP